MKLFKTSDMHIVKYCQHCFFPLTCRVICGKSEPERLNVNSVNFVSIYRVGQKTVPLDYALCTVSVYVLVKWQYNISIAVMFYT